MANYTKSWQITCPFYSLKEKNPSNKPPPYIKMNSMKSCSFKLFKSFQLKSAHPGRGKCFVQTMVIVLALVYQQTSKQPLLCQQWMPLPWNWLAEKLTGSPAQGLSNPALESLPQSFQVELQIAPQLPAAVTTTFDLICPLVWKCSMRMPELPFILLPKADNLQRRLAPHSLAAVFWYAKRSSSGGPWAGYLLIWAGVTQRLPGAQVLVPCLGFLSLHFE